MGGNVGSSVGVGAGVGVGGVRESVRVHKRWSRSPISTPVTSGSLSHLEDDTPQLIGCPPLRLALTSRLMRLNSSKHAHAPDDASPLKNFPMAK